MREMFHKFWGLTYFSGSELDLCNLVVHLSVFFPKVDLWTKEWMSERLKSHRWVNIGERAKEITQASLWYIFKISQLSCKREYNDEFKMKFLLERNFSITLGGNFCQMNYRRMLLMDVGCEVLVLLTFHTFENIL